MNPGRPTLIVTCATLGTLAFLSGAQAAELADCQVVREGQTVELRSPNFAFRLRLDAGLKAQSWENRITGTRFELGGGEELEIDVGLPTTAVNAVQWLASATQIKKETPGEFVVELKAEQPRLSAVVRYSWDAANPVLRKFVQITNEGDRDIDRLLNVRLGNYAVPDRIRVPDSPDRGFPAYLDGERFVSLAHPAGFAQVENGRIVLRQYPGTRLRPGQLFACMETVYGVGSKGEARPTFTQYVRSRTRRVLRGHDKPYAILESFGGQPNGDFWTTEQYLLEHLAKVEQGLREGGPRFDFYCTEFWHDSAGDLTTFHRKNFPNGYAKVRDTILRLGMRPGLWIDSGGLPSWTIGDNPAVRGCYTKPDGKGELCRATEPINTLYRKAFIHHVRENKVGLLKFDNMGPACQFPCCDNPAHDHLPGPLYSVEAIHNAIIDFLHELDAACPDVFVMLYWGYRSPWWLEYGDTYFENGAHIEAASPTDAPTLYARDSVTQRLDQAQSLILDTPWLGKDSLGVWLSDWPWNSCVGKARWQEGVIMDLCRGSLLAQVWTDTNWLTPAERKQLAEFIALLKANPDCFENARLVLGDPFKREPYGYACSNGSRAFLAIHNPSFEEKTPNLQLAKACGLTGEGRWDIYRWYPHPAKLEALAGKPPVAQDEQAISLRPCEIVLLEVVPSGKEPSLQRTFENATIAAPASEPSRKLDLQVTVKTRDDAASRSWQVLKPASAAAGKARLTVREDGSILAGGETIDRDVYTVTSPTGLQGITAIMLEALTDDSLPSRGPGRAENGNLALTSFHVMAGPAGQPDKASEVKIRSATADFAQTTHGGWPIAAAIDADPASGWSIYPQVGAPHAAIFTLEKPIDVPGPAVLTIKLTQGERGHALGCLRLWVSTASSPSLPAAYAPGEFVAETNLPASQSDRILLLTGDRSMDLSRATLAGRPLQLEPVWSPNASWACPWRAWRAPLGPDADVRRLEITVQQPQAASPSRFEAYLLSR